MKAPILRAGSTVVTGAEVLKKSIFHRLAPKAGHCRSDSSHSALALISADYGFTTFRSLRVKLVGGASIRYFELRARRFREVHALPTARPLDRLDVVHAAAVPLRADLGAARGGKVLKQARHRAGGSVCGYQLVATEGRLPVTLTAGDEDGISQLVGEAIERLLGRVVAAPFRDSRTRIREHVGPPFLGRRLGGM